MMHGGEERGRRVWAAREGRARGSPWRGERRRGEESEPGGVPTPFPTQSSSSPPQSRFPVRPRPPACAPHPRLCPFSLAVSVAAFISVSSTPFSPSPESLQPAPSLWIPPPPAPLSLFPSPGSPAPRLRRLLGNRTVTRRRHRES